MVLTTLLTYAFADMFAHRVGKHKLTNHHCYWTKVHQNFFVQRGRDRS